MSNSNWIDYRLEWFHRYPARFSKALLSEILDEVTKELGRCPFCILDPFAGTGATLAAAKQLGISSIGYELTHLGALIAKVRLFPPPDTEQAVSIAVQCASSKRASTIRDVDQELYVWLGDDNCHTLKRIVTGIKEQENRRIRDFLFLALSSALRPASIWLPGSIKPQIDPSRKHSDLARLFIQFAKRLKRDCDLESEACPSNCEVKIIRSSSHQIDLPDKSIDVVITSPPYATMYDYYDVHRLTYLAYKWPQYNHLQLGRSKHIESDGFMFTPPKHMVKWYSLYDKESTIAGRSIRAYWQGMRYHLSEVNRVLLNGGLAVYVIANTYKKGMLFNLADSLSAVMEETGFVQVRKRARMPVTRRILPAGRSLETGRFDSQAEPLTTEYIILARKL